MSQAIAIVGNFGKRNKGEVFAWRHAITTRRCFIIISHTLIRTLVFPLLKANTRMFIALGSVKFYWKKDIPLFSKDALNWLKLRHYILQINALLLNAVRIHRFYKIKQHNSFQDWKKKCKCFLSIKFAYYNDFWSIIGHWKREYFSFAITRVISWWHGEALLLQGKRNIYRNFPDLFF